MSKELSASKKEIKLNIKIIGSAVMLFFLGISFTYLGFDKLPQQNNLTIVNGKFDHYDMLKVGKNGTFTQFEVFLENGYFYGVPYFENYPSQRSSFLKKVKQGQPLTLWIDEDPGLDSVYAIQSGKKTFLSYEDAVRDYNTSSITLKIFGILFLLLSGIFFVHYLRRKQAKPK